MPTNVLTASENLEGNISSCRTELTVVKCINRENPFYCEDRGWATNNCTGDTEVLTSWSFTGFFYLSLIIVTIIGIALVDRLSSRRY